MAIIIGLDDYIFHYLKKFTYPRKHSSRATYEVVLNPCAIPVLFSSYRLVSDQKQSGKTIPPPRMGQPRED